MKKNVRIIPRFITLKLSELKEKDISVVANKMIFRNDIENGKWKHLGINILDGILEYPSSVLPNEEVGKYSSWNANGREIIRRDLPKETHYNTVETPNWGDEYNGTHSVDLPYEKYPRDYIAAKESNISISCSNRDSATGPYQFTFILQSVLRKGKQGFSEQLLADLNIMQENTGSCDIEEASITHENYVKSLYVAWEILPPGTKEEAINRLFKGRAPNKEELDVASDRYDFFKSLNAKNFIYGASGLRRYFGALIREDLVVFENIEYGNAVYVLFDDWQTLSKKSRLEIMSGRHGAKYERVPHNIGWQNKTRKIISEAQS
jgi:hypothetical protein